MGVVGRELRFRTRVLAGWMICLVAAVAVGAWMPTAALAVVPSSWAVVPSPSPSSPDNELYGISCTSLTFCMAAGTDDAGVLIESWNGKGWAVSPSPSPGKLVQFLGVSCPSSSFCVGVGGYRTSVTSSTYENLIETWNGSTWSMATPATGLLEGVSCLSQSFCVAVGYTSGPQTLIEMWNGSSWAVNASTATGKLRSVSCASAGFCVAVGDNAGNPSSSPLIATWDGSSWAITAGLGRGTNSSLMGVSCLPPTNCMAVGYSDQSTLTELIGAGSRMIEPSPGNGSLQGISCLSESLCVAVGQSFGAVGETLGETWDGRAWTITPTVNPNSGNNLLFGVSCIPAACEAAGYDNDSNETQDLTLIEDGAVGAVAGPFKALDRQAAKAKLNVDVQAARVFCTPHALGILGFGTGILLSATSGPVGFAFYLTVTSTLTAFSTQDQCLMALRLIRDDYLRWFNDPPDPNYTTLANPAPIKPVRMPSCKRWRGGVKAFCQKLSTAEKKWAQAGELAVSIDDALLTTRDRESSALAADDQAAVNLQDAHIPGLEKQLTAALATESADGKAIARLLKAHHISYRMTKGESSKIINAILKVLARQSISKADLSAAAPRSLTPRATNILAILAHG